MKTQSRTLRVWFPDSPRSWGPPVLCAAVPCPPPPLCCSWAPQLLPVWSITDNTAVSTHVHVFLCVCARELGGGEDTQESEAGPRGTRLLSSSGHGPSVPVAASIYTLGPACNKFPLLHTLPNTLFPVFFILYQNGISTDNSVWFNWHSLF